MRPEKSFLGASDRQAINRLGHFLRPDVLARCAVDRAQQWVQSARNIFERSSRLVPFRADQRRETECFDCGTRHDVSRTAASSSCPQCGAYIDLRDIDVRDRAHRKIRTRGTVTVHSGAVLASPGIQCGDLRVFGQISGSVRASGTVTFAASGKVLGEIHCRHFVVEKRSRIQFLQRVFCETADIRGSVAGDLCCRNQLTVRRGGSVDGVVLAGRMQLDEGGVINGPTGILSRANIAGIRANPSFAELVATFDLALLD